MNNETECGSQGSIELDLLDILASRSPIHFAENKCLHRVDVNEGLHEFVVRVRQNFWSQGLSHINIFDHFKNLLPNVNMKSDNRLEILDGELIKLIDLGKDQSVEYLLRTWQDAKRVVEVAKDHESSRFEKLLVVPPSPIPA